MAVFNHYRHLLKTKTRDTSAVGLQYLKGLLLMDKDRTYKNIARTVSGNPDADGQDIQQFMSDSPWDHQAVFRQVRWDISASTDLLGGTLNFDESGEEGGSHKAGAARQYLGRHGKVDMGQVGVLSSYSLNGLWLLTDAELFLPKKWFDEPLRQQWNKLHIPSHYTFQSKLALATQQFDRAITDGLPFKWVGGDSYYGQSMTLRRYVAQRGYSYLFSVPKDTVVWLTDPLQTTTTEKSQTVETLAQQADFNDLEVRWSERGMMTYAHAFIPVWTINNTAKVADRVAKSEILVIRKENDGKLSYALSNALQASPQILAQQRSERYFVERTIQDSKSELGWSDLQALKYRAYMHELAIAAIGLVFATNVKIKQRLQFDSVEEVKTQLQIEQLPDLSLSNIKELLRATMPLPQLTKEQACQAVVNKLYGRTRATCSKYHKLKRKKQNIFSSS